MPQEYKQEQTLEDMFSFDLPSGDAGVVQKRQDVEFNALGGSTYGPGETIEFKIAPGRQALDPRHCYIAMKFAVTDATGAAALATPSGDALTGAATTILPAGTAGLVSRLQIMTESGTIIEDIEDYNRLQYLIDAYTVTDQWRANEGARELIPCPLSQEPVENEWNLENNAGAETITAAVTISGITTDSTFYRAPGWVTRQMMQPHMHLVGSASAETCILRLRASALFGSSTIIPPAAGTLTVRLTLAPANIALTSIAQAAGSHGLVVNVNMNPHAAAVGTEGPYSGASLTPTATYRIWNPKFKVRTLELSSSFMEAMNKAQAGEGLPRTLSTWFTTQAVIPASNSSAPLSITANKVAANARACVFQINPTAADDAKNWAANSFDMVDHGLSEWRIRLGVQHFPDRYVDNPQESLERVSHAIPLMGDRKSASVPLVRYNPNLVYTNLGSTPRGIAGTDAAGTVTKYIYPTKRPNLVVRGVTFQNVQGLDLSGLSTNLGSQIEAQLKWNTDTADIDGGVVADVKAANASSIAPATLRMHVLYTRLLVFKDGNVEIRE